MKTGKHKRNSLYISVNTKFVITLVTSLIWMVFSIFIAKRWFLDLANDTNWVLSCIIIFGVAIIPGWMNAFLLVSLILDKQPQIKDDDPHENITLLVAAFNEESTIYNTLGYIDKQDYSGNIRVIVIDNNSSDATVAEVMRAKNDFSVDIECIFEKEKGKFNALNSALKIVDTEYTITLDADTILHKSAVRYLVARIKESPEDVQAVAGAVLVRNSRDNLLAKVQEWDYFLSICSVKRMQGLYQGTLVAQGAFSLYKTEALREIGGWSDAIGEDIVLTWDLLKKGYRVYFEPKAISFTEVPTKFRIYVRQRSRWARGMIEGLRKIKPWQQPTPCAKFLTGLDLIIPYMDFSYTLFWTPGLVLALFGKFYIVGPMTILVLPLTFLTFYILYLFQKKRVFDPLNLKVRKNKIGLLIFILFYQFIMSPVSLYGYVQEMFHTKRVWK